ncbi:hypothetical protein IQ217_09455 [Synechocystis salina LEGE 00031]|uniref:Uncharacterized protein n=1 Tax=Synechocystis salina LEGE 00031 TaxID=1828736 RepID=A0ABR9VUD4_9SYNC|nr:hypothetical protein [Synechocystis salina LEGE 00041]MBE9254063.1 hypothetical protein [Synechocystis salina LEGE 00031]
MTKPTLNSSDSLPIPDSGAMDSLWQPSWLHWLISALSGTVEIEKQTAWLKKHNEELRKSNEELRKSNEEFEKSNAEWLKKEQMSLEELRRENARLRELESKLDAVLPRYNSSLTPQTEIEDS